MSVSGVKDATLWGLFGIDLDGLTRITNRRQEILDGIEREIARFEANLAALRKKPRLTMAGYLILEGFHGTRN
jgi:hypothetical protein